MPDGKRLWRTEEGGLVEDGDPAAVTLAYGEDDEVEDEADKALVKKATEPRNKKAPAPSNK